MFKSIFSVMFVIFVGVCFCFNGITAQIFFYGCPKGWVNHDAQCYRFVSELLFYEEAEAACFSQGAQLASITTSGEHEFISSWLRGTSRENFWLTSGYYMLGRVYWDEAGLISDPSGYTYWLDNRAPGFSSKLYRIAYTHTETEYRWTNITGSTPAAYICEVEQGAALAQDILNRDYDYGLGVTDVKEIQRGPVIVRQPEDIYYIEGAWEVDFECVATGTPLPRYTWWRRGNVQEIATQVTSAISNRYTITGGRLVISSPEQTEDQFMYHCKAENEVGAVLSNEATLYFGYLDQFSNIRPKPVYAAEFKGTKMECGAPSYSPRVNYEWFKNAATNIFVYEGHGNLFVSNDGSLYVSEVQPTDANKNYFCVVTLVQPDNARFAKSNSVSRTNMGIELLLSGDTNNDADYGPILHTNVFPQNTIKGSNIRMECVAYGSPPLNYQWYRADGRPFVAGTKLRDLNRVLTIDNASLEAEGDYICRCTRGSGSSKTQTITLNMDAKPYFPYPIGNKFLDVGMRFDWHCMAVARPKATYSWYKNGARIDSIPGVLEIRANVLTILSVDKLRDEGMYQCAATNNYGTTFSLGELKVLALTPNFKRHPLPQVTLVPLGGNANIPCSVEGAPTPTVTWIKNGGPMGLTPGNLNDRIGMDTSYGLVLTSIAMSDQGLYTCKADNQFGTATNSTEVRVVDGIIWRSRLLNETNVQVNRTAFLYCEASTNVNFDISYVWKFNGHPINFLLQKEYILGMNGLYVTNAQYKNMGRYECEARTTIHSKTSSGLLRVNGPPLMPAGVYVLDNTVTPRSVTLVWTWFVAIEHGAPIVGYDIEAESNFKPNVWTVVAADIPESIAAREAADQGKRGTQRAATVDGLIPNTNYRFRVRATNAFGKGQEASKPTTSVKLMPSAPVVAPRNVGGGGGKVGTLQITWDILEPAEHCGDNLNYIIYWKKMNDAKDYKREIGNTPLSLVDGKYVIEVGVDNYYLQYQIMVAARNSKAQGPNSTVQYIYSAEAMPAADVRMEDMETFNGTCIIVHWESVADTREAVGGKIRGYRVQYFADMFGNAKHDEEPDPNVLEVLSKDVYGQTDHVKLVGLYSNMEYLARVMVINGAGVGTKGNWRRGETYNDMLHDFPTHIKVYEVSQHSVRVHWRGVGVHAGEESLEGYIIRIFKVQEDIRNAVDTTVGKVNEAIINGLQSNTVYVCRVLGTSRAGDGALSEAVYFSLTSSDSRSVNLNIDPSTSEVCYSDNDSRTCGVSSLRSLLHMKVLIAILTVFYIISS
ncbi:contactin-like isoform X2 [Mya arenaria]|uniref:contactin-like isoform X2 n=1 Tax=Mya arenaria TaxID=6604 RepID=UPI0022E275FF|nr:contactin-like isoform X2 [Mya arenaria]